MIDCVSVWNGIGHDEVIIGAQKGVPLTDKTFLEIDFDRYMALTFQMIYLYAESLPLSPTVDTHLSIDLGRRRGRGASMKLPAGEILSTSWWRKKYKKKIYKTWRNGRATSLILAPVAKPVANGRTLQVAVDGLNKTEHRWTAPDWRWPGRKEGGERGAAIWRPGDRSSWVVNGWEIVAL